MEMNKEHLRLLADLIVSMNLQLKQMEDIIRDLRNKQLGGKYGKN